MILVVYSILDDCEFVQMHCKVHFLEYGTLGLPVVIWSLDSVGFYAIICMFSTGLILKNAIFSTSNCSF
jgi:hypothetical protein